MDAADLEVLIAAQRAALVAINDQNLAFRLQLEETRDASLSSLPSSSKSVPAAAVIHDADSDDLNIADEIRRAAVDLDRNYDEPFRLYFKGMYADEDVQGKKLRFAGIGVAVCDRNDKLVIKVQKPVAEVKDMCREVVEAKALIRGLDAVNSLGIKRVNVYFDFKVLYNHAIKKWKKIQPKIVTMLDQVFVLSEKLESCNMLLLPRSHVQFVFRLAREVIDAQISKNSSLSGNIRLNDTCNICMDDTDPSQMFSVNGCLHRFCLNCMRQHVEVKLRDVHGMLPGCPQDGCKITLDLESSRKLLSENLYNIMSNRIREASIPATQKLYCPYPRCSALMSKYEAIRVAAQKGASSSKSYKVDVPGLRKCIKCSGQFCIYCKVPWHTKMSCNEYKRSNSRPRVEDARLRSLAKNQLWRQCVKCKHMIELLEGCFHMTCSCGYEFCYTCGAEWKNKKATCSCPLFEERRILHEESSDFDSDSDSDF